jgi:hypothetical protein
MSDKYRKIEVPGITLEQLLDIVEAVKAIPAPTWTAMLEEFRGGDTYVCSAGHPAETDNSAIAAWQNAVKQAIADVIGHPVSPAWVPIQKGVKLFTPRDLQDG